jgi:hypothetical protein
MVRAWILAAAVWLPATVGVAASRETLGPGNFPARVAITDTRPFMGDFVLSSSAVTAVVADPGLVTGRSSSRWSIPNVAGGIVSLVGAGQPVNGLVAFYPGPVRFQHDAPQKQADFGDESLAAARPDRRAETGPRVALELPAYVAESGVALAEILALPEHRRGPARPLVAQTYRVSDGREPFGTGAIVSETTYRNPGTEARAARVTSRLDTVGRTHWGIALEGRLVWCFDADRDVAYGVVCDAGTLAAAADADGLAIDPADVPGGAVELGPGATVTIRRAVVTAADVPGVVALARAALALPPLPGRPLTITAGPTAAGARVLVEALRAGVVVSAQWARGGAAILPSIACDAIRLGVAGVGTVTHAVGPEPVDRPLALAAPVSGTLHVEPPAVDAGPAYARVTVAGPGGAEPPRLGPLWGREAVANTFIVGPGLANEVSLAPGRYDLTITAGPRFDTARETVVVEPGRTVRLAPALRRAFATPGWIAADLHQHTVVSGRTRRFYVSGYEANARVDGDGVADPQGRLLALLATGIDLVVATEHNFVFDYAGVARAANLQDRIATLPGIGLSAGRRHTTQHHNVFPAPYRPGRQDGGALQRPEHIGQLWWARQWDTGADKLIVAVQPAGTPITVANSIDAIDLDDFATLGQGLESDAWRRSQTSLWLALLAEGYRLPGVAGSRSFDNAPDTGRIRTWLALDRTAITPGRVVDAVRGGRAVLTTGPFLTLELLADDGAAHGPSTTARRVAARPRLRVVARWNDSLAAPRLGLLLNGRPGPAIEPTADEAAARTVDRVLALDVADDTFVQATLAGRSAAGPPEAAITNPLYLDVGAEGFLPASPLHDRVKSRLAFTTPVPAEPGGRGVVEVTLENAVDEPSTDELALVPEPERHILVTPPAQAYTIPPRGSLTLRFEVGLTAEALAGDYPVRAWTYVSRDLVVTSPRSSRPPGRRPASISLDIDHPLPRVAAGDDPAAVPAALAAVRPLGFRGRRQESLGQVRLALSGDRLAVTAEVHDPRPRRDSLLTGSVEVFGAMPGSGRIRSVGLQPAAADEPPRAVAEVEGRLEILPEARVASTPIADGYRIDALVPLERLGLDAARPRLLIEVRANATRDGTPVQQTTMGNRAPQVDHGPFPRFRPVPPAGDRPR